MTRTFTVVDYPNKGDEYGTFKGNSPKQAAKKAINRLSKIYGIKNTNKENMIIVTLREKTRNNKNKGKLYKYIGTRVELINPIVVNINGKNITYKYKTIITKYANVI